MASAAPTGRDNRPMACYAAGQTRGKPHDRHRICRANSASALVLFLMLTACGCDWRRARNAPDYAAVVAAPDRAEADRQADARRKPAQASRLHRRQARDEGAGYGDQRRLQHRISGARGRSVRQGLCAGFGGRDRALRERQIRHPRQKARMQNVVHVVREFRRSDPARGRRISISSPSSSPITTSPTCRSIAPS